MKIKILKQEAMPRLILFSILFLCLPLIAAAQDMPAQRPAQMLSAAVPAPQQTEDWLPLRSQKSQDDLHDHLARVFEMQGEARILKHGTDAWAPLQKDMTIEVGDQILTGEKSQVRITYDNHFLNIAVIKEQTKAEFRSIEPTDLHLEDGSIFSVVDKLNGDSYQISTPTAVAAVRGTHFETGYSAQTGAFNVNLFPDGGEASHVVVTDLEQGQEGPSVELNEGEKLVASDDNVTFNQELVQPMSSEEVNQYHQELGSILETTDTHSRLEALAEPEAPVDPSPSEIANEGNSFADTTNIDHEVDQALESQLGDNSLLGDHGAGSLSENGSSTESGSNSVTETHETENQESTLTENPAPVPDPAEIVPETETTAGVVSLQDQVTSETAQDQETPAA